MPWARSTSKAAPTRRKHARDGSAVVAQRSVSLAAGAAPKRKPEKPSSKRAGGCGVIELPSRPESEYTVERYLCALESLESGGSFRLAADLTRAAMTEWGFASGLLDTITGGTLGLQRNVIVAPGDERIAEALEGRQGVGGDLDRLEPRAEAKQVMAWGVVLGIGVGQRVRADCDPVYQPPDENADQTLSYRERLRWAQRNRAPSLLAWDSRWIRYQWWDRRIFLMTDSGEVEIHPGRGDWVIYMPHGRSYPWRYGHWKWLDLAFVMQRDAVFDRSRHQQLSPPVRVGLTPEGTSERQRQKFLKQIEEMQRFGVFVLPAGLKYEVVESSTSGQVDAIYAAAIAHAEREATVGLTGNMVSVEGSKGFSEGDYFERIAASKRKFYAESWAETEQQILGPYTDENYPTAQETPYILRNTDPPEDQDKKIERVDKFGKAIVAVVDGLARVGAEIEFDSIKEMAQGLGLTVKLKPAGAAPASKIEVTPSDVAKVVKAEELRASEGLPPFGDERDQMTLAELEAAVDAGNAAPEQPIGAAVAEPQAMAFSRGYAAEYAGISVLVEYEPGDVRSGVGPDGAWSQVMRCGYGCILGVRGPDKEWIDCYLGPNPGSDLVWVVDQVKPDGAPDEPKVMLGFDSEREASDAYQVHAPSWAFGGIRQSSAAEVLYA